MSFRPYDNCTLMLYRTSGMQTVADIRVRSRNNGRSGVAIEWCTSRLFTVYAKINNATPDSVTCLYMDVRAEFQSVIGIQLQNRATRLGVRQLTLQQKRLATSHEKYALSEYRQSSSYKRKQPLPIPET